MTNPSSKLAGERQQTAHPVCPGCNSNENVKVLWNRQEACSCFVLGAFCTQCNMAGPVVLKT